MVGLEETVIRSEAIQRNTYVKGQMVSRGFGTIEIERVPGRRSNL